MHGIATRGFIPLAPPVLQTILGVGIQRPVLPKLAVLSILLCRIVVLLLLPLPDMQGGFGVRVDVRPEGRGACNPQGPMLSIFCPIPFRLLPLTAAGPSQFRLSILRILQL